jgi:hypothetical protein
VKFKGDIMYKICVLCEARVQDGDAVPSPQHEEVYFCPKCYTIQKFIDGLSIDINIYNIEDTLSEADPNTIEFDRGLKDVN